MAFDFVGLLKTIAPGIATALGGPLAGAAVSFLAGKFGTENTQEAVSKALEGFTAADIVKMKELDNQFALEMAKLGIQLDAAQIAVNQEEAKSVSLFVAGGRPAAIWAGVFSMVLVSIVMPIAQFVALLCGYTGAFPIIDTSITVPVLLGLLGLSGMRTFEKYTGTQGNH